MNPGIYHGLDMKKYHADPALSRSDIVRLNMSPLTFKKHVDKDKPEYRLGRSLHGLVLEGVQPLINPHSLRTNKGKAFQEESPDAVTQDMGDMIRAMAERTKDYFVDGEAEVSFFWEDDSGEYDEDAETGWSWADDNGISGNCSTVMCKCRPDWISNGVCYDFKTTRQSLEDWHWDVRRFSYDVQDVWYLSGIEQHQPIFAFRFVVIEKTAPYRVRVFEIDDKTRAWGIVRNGLSIYRQCTKSGDWSEPDLKVYHI